jgi:uncharacterized lipoprotein YddW (UPF0748 family)
VLLAHAALAPALGAQAAAAAAAASLEGAAPRELRAAWVASVGNIDWPSRPGLTAAAQRDELLAILDGAASLHLNALVLQVRPMCDALYASPLEPWSEWLTGAQGRAPDPPWDPLAFAVEQAHARGLELHAWFNPFRARHTKSRTTRPAPNHVGRRMPEAVVAYGEQLWLDPGDPAAQRHSLQVILDVVGRYDIDGVHLDDYFYPYPEPGLEFDDSRSWQLYRSEGGSLSRADWRRANVDRFVARLYASVKQHKVWVKVGLSPFGIARPNVPPGIHAGLDQYAQLYADPCKWLANGWCDYLAPQLYWPVGQREQSYATLLPWWQRQNRLGRHLWPGSFTSRAVAGPDAWPLEEIEQQIACARRVPGVDGHIHFSWRALVADGGRIGNALRRGPYRARALVPSSPWLAGEAPPPPATASLTATRLPAGEVELRWSAATGARWWAVYGRGFDPSPAAGAAAAAGAAGDGRAADASEWQLLATLPGSRTELRLAPGQAPTAAAVAALDRFGRLGRAAVAMAPAR